MSIWFNKERRNYFDDAEDLANLPEGGRAKMWLAGAGLACVPVVYGAVCLHRGYTTLFGSRGASEAVYGWPGVALAVAYMGIGMFIHFHYFWGLNGRLWRFSTAGKMCALAVLLPSLLYALWHVFADNAI